MPTISLDDGLFLENVLEEVQPGTNVRRVNGKRLTDEKMSEYYIGLVNQYGSNGKLTGYFLKGVAVATTEQIKNYYDNDDFEQDDIYDIAHDTDKEDELFGYADIDNYYSKGKDDELEL